jgi:predicted CoA-binding protein
VTGVAVWAHDQSATFHGRDEMPGSFKRQCFGNGRKGVASMDTDLLLREILTKYRNIAVVGMSKNPEKPAHSVPAYLSSQGYNIIPVNPSTERIMNRRSYSSLKEVEESVDVVEVFRPSDQVLDIVKEAIERRKERGDIKVIWLQEGIANEEAESMAERESITFVQNRCMYKELKRSLHKRNGE